MVKLTKIYTRTGDEGMTGLSDFTRVRKTDSRIEAYADVDEANSAIGLALSFAKGEFDAETVALVTKIQNELFDLGADLATPIHESYEKAIDKYNSALPKRDSFILPSGTSLAAGLHLARTVVRRAERATWHAIEAHGVEPSKKGADAGGINVLTAKYLNRLSDLLFVLARTANGGNDVKWIPGTQRD